MRILLCDSRIKQIYAVKFISNDYYERSYQHVVDMTYFERIFRTIISNVYFERLFRTIISNDYFERLQCALRTNRELNEIKFSWFSYVVHIQNRCLSTANQDRQRTKRCWFFFINFYFKNNECKLINSFTKKEFRFRLSLIMIQCDDENYDDFKSHFFSTHES